MFGVNFNYFSDEDDGFKGRHASLLLEQEERVHEGPDHAWNRLRIELSNLIDTLNQEIPVLIRA